MLNRLTALLFDIFKFITQKLPVSRAYLPGKFLGQLAYKLSGSRGENSRQNIMDAFNADKNKADKILKKVYSNLGMNLSEFLLQENIGVEDIDNIIEYENIEYLDKCLDRGKGVIIYTGHFGNWELMGAALTLKGYKVNAIARTQNNSIMDEKINYIRENVGVNIIPKGASVRKAYKALKQGEIVVILGDQDARENGWKMEFFDKPASTYTGAVQLAERTGAAVVPAFLLREGWLKHKFLFYSPIFIDRKAGEAVQRNILQDLLDITEEIIRRYPDQWMWLHKRWKTYQ
ncbi:lysophospholipid acyltransferase family protein [Halanaerobium sp. MA284_MarDTE_T2]|uniref:lysophospholipid acyltransferase family protein n=1 Tax=Halanaerobium sp. MA284_MarDTE_T2 TaxID=2183913 RepID=UPI000DF39BC9|nr:lysophospholipid acyltransferase family protein [Halanaerobium sp. MA284_MarDTE_T2]RCW45017.1 KDO2-lipid IV(A) lauroyltransferase [Halanaerobium sp. MA284_MarDTE_T2]